MEPVIWIIFTLIFAFLAYHHWKLTKSGIELKKLFGSDTLAQIRALNQSETPTGLVMFVEKFNSEFRDLNEKLMWGYIVAAGTALFSCLLSLHLV